MQTPITQAILVRQSSNPADPKPYQVRRILSDQTFTVIARYASAAAAYMRADREITAQPFRDAADAVRRLDDVELETEALIERARRLPPDAQRQIAAALFETRSGL